MSDINELMGNINQLTVDFDEPTLQQKVKAAIFMATMGVENSGIRGKAWLMYPLREFSDFDVQRESARFLGDVLTALLEVLPPQRLEQILKDQATSVLFRG
ncbi:MAG: hypothetical protein KTR20_12760 [Cellvibrionaceae bacterium]|nr:hypothetical protein [Cellvibrionaceae bacterium]